MIINGKKREKKLDKNPGSHLERVTLSRCLPHSWPLSPAEGEMMTNRCPKCGGNAGFGNWWGKDTQPNLMKWIPDFIHWTWQFCGGILNLKTDRCASPLSDESYRKNPQVARMLPGKFRVVMIHLMAKIGTLRGLHYHDSRTTPTRAWILNQICQDKYIYIYI